MSRLVLIRLSAQLVLLLVLLILAACSSGDPAADRAAVGSTKPVSNPGVTPTSGPAPLNVSLFDAGSEPVGGVVKWEWNFGEEHDGKGGWHDFTATLGAASHTYASSGTYDVQLRVTDAAGKRDTARLTVTVSESDNQPPAAMLEADVTAGFAPLTVNFDASGSTDPDGSIVSYDWDFDGDGTYDLLAGSAQEQHSYSSGGLFDATVRITDDDGAQGTATQQVWAQVWQTLTVDASDDVGLYTSLSQIGGNPAISYYDLTSGDLKYAYSSMADGSSGWSSLTVDAAGDVGVDTSLAEVVAKPAISYRDVTNADLKYAYSSAADGSSGWSALTVDSAADTGRHSSLAVVDGRPAIACSVFNTTVRYAYSSTLDGSSGWTVISTGSIGNNAFTSMEVVSGKPSISYVQAGTGDLVFARSAMDDGSSGWTRVTVDTPLSGWFSSLAEVNGKPAIGYHDFSTKDIEYAYSSTVDGSAGWTTVTVAASGNTGGYTSLAVVGGKPALSYFDAVDQDLKYAYSSTVDGSGAWTVLTVDSAGFVGPFTSLAVLADGRPAISYCDSTNVDLKFAWAQ